MCCLLQKLKFGFMPDKEESDETLLNDELNGILVARILNTCCAEKFSQNLDFFSIWQYCNRQHRAS